MNYYPIPNGETLFRYINPLALPPDQTEVPAGIFNDSELSCDWERYQKDPTQSYHIVQGKTCIVQISVCDEIREIENPKRTGQFVADWKQDILHNPIAEEDDLVNGENYAHALIKGKKKAAVVEAIASKASFFRR